ncbi:gliding motility-associated ABC transporter ATP-binding subunit GldA [Puteibacter caeruleilacunae]|nr:gliding motility-associated ABC transporter ATP-binding subunit GldA [Puteibacter caeruleilacunae]
MSVKVENIVKYYGNQCALNQVSFEIQKGEVVGFLGPNGAGKSTMMKIITGCLEADDGTVHVDGELMDTNVVNLRSKIGYLPEHNPLYGEMFVEEYLKFIAGIYHLKNKKQRIDEVVRLTGLTPERHKKIQALSKGYKQRVGIAQALIHDPEVLILDEPTTGLDPNQLDEIRGLIRDVSNEKTVMLSTHIMQEVDQLCDRVIIVDQGNIVADDELSLLKQHGGARIQRIYIEFEGEIDQENLRGLSFIDNLEQKENGYLITSTHDEDVRPLLFKYAVENNYILLTLNKMQEELENIFKRITQ